MVGSADTKSRNKGTQRRTIRNGIIESLKRFVEGCLIDRQGCRKYPAKNYREKNKNLQEDDKLAEQIKQKLPQGWPHL